MRACGEAQALPISAVMLCGMHGSELRYNNRAVGMDGVLHFILARSQPARYTLVRDLGYIFASGVDRLDARPCLRADVSDALL